jgi:hypothetical protein
MSAWSHLPNATQIDRVIASLKKHPEIWDAAWNTVWRAKNNPTWDMARESRQNLIRDRAQIAAWVASRNVSWNARQVGAGRIGRGSARFESYNGAWDAALALLAYEDCEQYLNMSSEELHAWATLTEQPAAWLLLPAVIAFERIAELETA